MLLSDIVQIIRAEILRDTVQPYLYSDASILHYLNQVISQAVYAVDWHNNFPADPVTLSAGSTFPFPVHTVNTFAEWTVHKLLKNNDPDASNTIAAKNFQMSLEAMLHELKRYKLHQYRV